MMSIYVILVSSSTALGPLIASYMVQYTPGSWRDYTWLCAALAGLNLILLILFYPESNFKRPHHEVAETQGNPHNAIDDDPEKRVASHATEHATSHGVQHVDHVHIPWTSIWFSFVTVDHSVSFVKTVFRPLLFLAFPNVLWAIFVYGVALSAQVILIFAFPSFLMAPPYLFSNSEVGLMQIAALIGLAIGTVAGGWLADIITAKQILKHKGHIALEFRFIALLPGCLVGPIGCIITAIACARHAHWTVVALGFSFLSFATVFASNIAFTYVVESYQDHTTESVVLVNAAKNLLAFVFLFTAMDWVNSSGWLQVYMVIFMLSVLSMLFAIPLYFFGARLRKWSLQTRIMT